jgi:hypothetical protein
MSDTPEHSTEYQPEEGAEVRPVSRYAAPPVLPGGLEELAREVGDEVPYRSVSLLAVGAFAVAVAYGVLVAIGGVAAFWFGARAALLAGTVLVPLLSVPIAMKFGVRGWPGLLRVAGLALAAFYAVPVGIGGLVAFSNHMVWLLPLWTFAVPLLAAAAGWGARLRIQASEDTLSGKALATWAAGLSLFFALCYAAYYTATYIAVRQQALQFAGEWIQTVQEDDLLRAYVLTKEPERRPTGDATAQRRSIELLSNPQNDEEGLGFTGFGMRPYVRLLRGTSKQNVELVAVRDFDYERGGYLLHLSYRVTTPYATFPLEVTVHGVESQKKDVKGRQWYVRSEMTGVRESNIQLTAKGMRLQQVAGEGQAFAEEWVLKLGRRDQNQMFQALAVARPDGVRREAAWQAFGGAAGPGVRAAAAQEEPFFKGDLVDADPKVFWATPDEFRAAVVARAKRLFAFGAGGDEALHVQSQRQVRWPLWEEDKATGRLLFRYEATAGLSVSYREQTPEGERQVDARVNLEAFIVLSCPTAVLESEDAPQWRVERVELVRARRADQGRPDPAGGRPGVPPRPGGAVQPPR